MAATKRKTPANEYEQPKGGRKNTSKSRKVGVGTCEKDEGREGGNRSNERISQVDVDTDEDIKDTNESVPTVAAAKAAVKDTAAATAAAKATVVPNGARSYESTSAAVAAAGGRESSNNESEAASAAAGDSAAAKASSRDSSGTAGSTATAGAGAVASNCRNEDNEYSFANFSQDEETIVQNANDHSNSRDGTLNLYSESDLHRFGRRGGLGVGVSTNRPTITINGINFQQINMMDTLDPSFIERNSNSVLLAQVLHIVRCPPGGGNIRTTYKNTKNNAVTLSQGGPYDRLIWLAAIETNTPICIISRSKPASTALLNEFKDSNAGIGSIVGIQEPLPTHVMYNDGMEILETKYPLRVLKKKMKLPRLIWPPTIEPEDDQLKYSTLGAVEIACFGLTVEKAICGGVFVTGV